MKILTKILTLMTILIAIIDFGCGTSPTSSITYTIYISPIDTIITRDTVIRIDTTVYSAIFPVIYRPLDKFDVRIPSYNFNCYEITEWGWRVEHNSDSGDICTWFTFMNSQTSTSLYITIYGYVIGDADSVTQWDPILGEWVMQPSQIAYMRKAINLVRYDTNQVIDTIYK